MLVWGLRAGLAPYLVVRDVFDRVCARRHPHRVLRRVPYQRGAIAVVALYQTGRARPDVLRLLLTLRRRGIYVIAVNAGTLVDGGARLPVDCYVERHNYGRDFASYQLGLSLARDWSPHLPRILLINDSVFFVSKGLDAFVDRLLVSTSHMTGATESEEVAPHIMSYCLSFTADCPNSDVFRKFWTTYRPTNIRPLTILRGEIKLSRELRRAGFHQRGLVPLSRLRTPAAGPVGGPDSRPGIAKTPIKNATHAVPAQVLAHGAPIVKLDLVSRGAADADQLQAVSRALPEADVFDFKDLIQERADRDERATRLEKLGARCGMT